MAEPVKTATSPVKQASKWDEYFSSNPSGITNSTGYQLYAVNEQTIASSLTGFTSGDVDTISGYIAGGTLNLQLADVAYNTKAILRQRLSWCNTIQKNIEIV